MHSIEAAFICGAMAAEIGPQRKAGAPRRAAARHRQGADSRGRRLARADRRRTGAQVRRIGEDRQRDRGASRGSEGGDHPGAAGRCGRRAVRARGRARVARCWRATSSGSRTSKRSPSRSRASRNASRCRPGARCGSSSSRARSPTRTRRCWRATWRKKIETDMTYPGQIRVTVIRETRATELARVVLAAGGAGLGRGGRSAGYHRSARCRRRAKFSRPPSRWKSRAWRSMRASPKLFAGHPRLHEFWFGMARDEARHVGALDLVTTVLDFEGDARQAKPGRARRRDRGAAARAAGARRARSRGRTRDRAGARDRARGRRDASSRTRSAICSRRCSSTTSTSAACACWSTTSAS